jgi:hypothetical protein
MTTNRWLIRIAKVSAAIVLVSCLLIVGERYFNFKKSLHSYRNIQMGAIRQEVQYRLGYPESVLGPLVSISDTEAKASGWPGGWSPVYYTDRKRDPKNAMPDDKTINDFPDWVYEEMGITFTVRFVDDKVSSLACMDNSGKRYSLCNFVAGVSIGDSEERISKILGKPTDFEYIGSAKLIRYRDLGLEFDLVKGEVYMITLKGHDAATLAMLRRFAGI